MRAPSVNLICLLLSAVFAGASPADEIDIEPIQAVARERPDDRRPLVTSVPEYPRKALRMRREGTVVVCFLIDSEGKVSRPLVLTSSGREFAKAAVKAVKMSSFHPVTDDERHARREMCRTFRFRLEPERTARR